MAAPLVLVTGFGPFLDVAANPSGEVALALAAGPPPGVEVRGAVLPVSLERVAPAYDELLRALPRAPAALLALGVHPGASFRLERRARPRLSAEKPDEDGRIALGIDLGGEELATALDLEPLAAAIARAGAVEVALSDDAGGYVCERAYHHVLRRAAERGIPALFLHVPPVEVVPAARQVPVVRALTAVLAPRQSSRQSSRSRRGRPSIELGSDAANARRSSA